MERLVKKEKLRWLKAPILVPNPEFPELEPFLEMGIQE